MINKALWFGLTIAIAGFVSGAGVQAQTWNNKTVLTFSQPVEVPGHVLPAGTYTFKLADSTPDRHIVQIFNEDESRIIATIMAIPDYRLISTDHTVISFNEVPSGSPETIRAWFYPGNTIGQEFVYPKRRALELARASKTVVPAIAVDMMDVAVLKTAPIVAMTPDEQEVPVAAAIQTTPSAIAALPGHSPSMMGMMGTTGVTSPNARRTLPQTASALPLIVLMGLGSVGVGCGLMLAGRRVRASAV